MSRGTAQDANMNADMRKELIEDAKEFAHQAFENCQKERDIATQIKHQVCIVLCFVLKKKTFNN